ncbi:MAG: hypothetical protein JW918_04150 [Anaerolineae bacterium]|nr:hypothetical protein [Anaerolineae bacterium]
MRSRSVAQESIIPLATLLILALAAAGPLWGPGLLNTRGGGDSPFNLLRVHQLAANLRAGVFPARWMPDAAYGLGYPFFSYYAALPYYLAAGLTVIGADILSAIKLTQTVFFAAAAAGMYGWARRALRNRAGGWLAAAAYAVAPYHLVNVYVRGDSLAEFAAFAFYPLILWGLDHLAERPSLNRTIPPALAYAGLILTHNLSAFIFSLCVLLPYTVFQVLRFAFQAKFCKLLHIVSAFIGALLIGVLLATWYWLPAIAETGDVQLTAQTTGYFAYDKHFRWEDLVQLKFIFDYYTITPEKPTAFAAMGLVQTLATIAGAAVVIFAYIRSRAAVRDSRFEISYLTFALTGLLLTTWLATPLSRPLWDLLPPLQMIQFPWRILSVQALFTALLAGAIPRPIALPTKGKGKALQWTVAAALALILSTAGLAGLRPEYLPIAAEEVTAARLQLYELFTGNVGSTIRYEYLPRWVAPRPFTGPALFDPDAGTRAIPLGGGLVSAEETAHEPTRRTWTVEADDGGAEVAFPIYYWPGWQATVDGTTAPVQAAPDSGTLTLPVPAGKHTVTLWLGRTPLRMGAELVSLATALGLLAHGFFTQRQETRSKRQEARGKKQRANHLPFAICYLLFAICLILLVLLHPRVDADTPDLTMDFDSLPYLHHNPDGVLVDDRRLLSYTYNTDRLAPGDTLQVTLDWEREPPQANGAALQLVSPAAIRQKELPAIAAAAPEANSVPLDLPIPSDLGPGMYLLRLTDEAAKVYLRPVWVSAEEPDGGQSGATFAEGALRLRAAEAKQTAPERLDLRLDWTAGRPIAANYGISLRLTDPAGDEWTRIDTQPGYGFLPTSLWPVARITHDHYTLQLPQGTPPGEAYTLTAILYRTSSGESVGEHRFPVSLDRAALRPDAPITAGFGDDLALSRLEVPGRVSQGESLHFTAYWLAVEQPATDYVAEWRLESAERAITATLPLAPGSPPTIWPAHGWIAGRTALPIPSSAPPGDYTLSLTLRDPDGASLGSYAHPQLVHVEGRERVWELPGMQREVGARFGDRPGGIIELAGYDLAQEGNALRLTLYWQALVAPERHYMFFVHVADPATGVPVTQMDAMPRGFTYPTGMWAAGEVISDEVRLSLAGVPPGQYDLAIGWYDPDNPSQRLPATDAPGNPLPDDRLVLPDSITVP